jgi:fumarate reductase flavoprotein subunit
MPDFDVLIIGSGAGGLSAALAADAAGATVLVAEAEAIIGGSSRLSGGQMMGANTRMQKRFGIEDSAEEFYHHYMTLNQWRLDPAVIRRFCEESGAAVDWLEEIGVRYYERMYFSGDERAPRDHAPDLDGAGVIEVLHARCKERPGIEFALKRRIDRLLVEDGRVVGAAVGDDEITAGAVIVASGGFGNNPELLARFWPEYVAAGDWSWYIGADGARGDHIGFAEQVGAQVVFNVPGQILPTPNFYKMPEVYFPGWLIMVEGHGRRFFDETSTYSITEPIFKSQQGPIYAIFDDAAKRRATKKTAGTAKKQDLPGPTTKKWIDEIIQEHVESGVVLKADSIAELARLIGVPEANLEGTISHYNHDVAQGEDSMFLKAPELMAPIDTAPFYATEIRLAFIGHTDVGFRIDADARVLSQTSWPVAGLYACGECTGNVIGNIYVGSGNSYASAVVFGRIAGRTAAAEATVAASPVSA